MELKYRKQGKALIVEVKGRMDAIAAPEFDTGCAKWIEEGEIALVVDLGGLEYMSSAGLRSILKITKALKAKGGQVRLCSLSSAVKKVFTMSGFSSFLPIDESIEEALSQS